MRSAQRESVTDFATTDYDIRMDIAQQIKERREALGYTSTQLAQSAGVSERHLNLVEIGYAFEESHDAACAALIAIDRLETLKAGTAHLRSI